LGNLDADVVAFLKRVGIEINFSLLKISESDYQLAVRDLNYDRLSNNPGKIDSELINNIYRYNNNA